ALMVTRLPGWLIARADRATQQRLEHSGRVYDRKARAYLDALASANRLYGLVRDYRFFSLPGYQQRRSALEREMFRPSDASLRAEMSAFGSSEAVTAYERVRRRFRLDVVVALNTPRLLLASPTQTRKFFAALRDLA